MSEKKDEKKSKVTKAKTKVNTKKKDANKTTSQRDSKGRFIKGESGNPGGRPKISEDFKNYAEKSPAELWKIVQDEETSKVLKANILMWFSEMYYGKARQQMDVDAQQTLTGTTAVKFEGVLDEWAQ